MDPKDRLIQEKNKILRQIADSAQRGNSQEVLVLGEKLNHIESLIKRCESLLQDIAHLENEDEGTRRVRYVRIGSRLTKDKDLDESDIAPGRGVGRTIRMAFLKKASENGIHLEHVKGTIYETQSGAKIGIAVATERKPDRWFLGLATDSFDHAVLLCKSDKVGLIEICLPREFLAEYADKMSQSGGQVKFNVARRGSRYVILIPGTDGINVSRFLENYTPLK